MSRALAAHDAEVALMFKRLRRRTPLEIQWEYLPEEQCRSVSPPPEEDYCVLPYGHEGPCSWRRKKAQ